MLKKFEMGKIYKPRNEPCRVKEVAEVIAGVRGCSIVEVCCAASRNGRRLFRLAGGGGGGAAGGVGVGGGGGGGMKSGGGGSRGGGDGPVGDGQQRSPNAKLAIAAEVDAWAARVPARPMGKPTDAQIAANKSHDAELLQLATEHTDAASRYFCLAYGKAHKKPKSLEAFKKKNGL